MNPFVSVIVPVYRNTETLVELHQRLCQALTRANFTFEIVFVDDACPAGSLSVLRKLADADERVGVLALKHNVGQHQAVLTGLMYAQGKWSVVLDADLQDPPEMVPDLVTRGMAGYPVVFGGRHGQYESSLRLFTSRLFKWMLHLLTGAPIDAGLFCALEDSLRDRLLRMAGPRPSLVAMIACTGVPMISIPFERSVRTVGKSAYTGWGRLKTAARAVGWVLNWKLRHLLRRPPVPATTASIRARYGARFTVLDIQEQKNGMIDNENSVCTNRSTQSATTPLL
ncbi:MAG: glycosyltransferase family 2 protein [Anaerolineae bacterium]|nr:glycosyltransferase family 2 protein [Thermoflexales bacterium]MDW8407257.1 glycosyltransferase family 2 protein [Anaerolineae bacterium]